MTTRILLLAATIMMMVILSLLPCSGQDAVPSLEKKSVLGGKVEILIPSTFTVMEEDMLKLKYPMQNRPALVYTNEAGSINVAFSLTTSKAEEKDVPEIKETFVKVFKSMYKSAEWLGDGLVTINGKSVGFMELITPAVDTRIYNRIFFAECDGRILLCTFNCKESQVTEWAPVGKKIMDSLVTK